MEDAHHAITLPQKGFSQERVDSSEVDVHASGSIQQRIPIGDRGSFKHKSKEILVILLPEICDPSCLKLMSKTLPLTKKRSTGVWRVQSCKGSSKPTTQVRSTSPKKPCPPRISICSIPILVQCKFAKRAIFHTMVQQN